MKRLLYCVLTLFFGIIGLHRLVFKRYKTGFLMFITIGGFGIWWLIDIVLVVIGKLGPLDDINEDQIDKALTPEQSNAPDVVLGTAAASNGAAEKVLKNVTEFNSDIFYIPKEYRQSVDEMNFLKNWEKYIKTGSGFKTFLMGIVIIIGGPALAFFVIGSQTPEIMIFFSKVFNSILPYGLGNLLGALVALVGISLSGIATILLGPALIEGLYHKYIKFSSKKLGCPSCKSKDLQFMEGQPLEQSVPHSTKSGMVDKRFSNNHMTGQFVGIWQCADCGAKLKSVHWRSYTMDKKSPIASVTIING